MPMETFRNQTRNVVVSEKTRVADTMGTRMVGLLSSSGLAEEEGLWIEPCNSIHTWFMRFTIDALFLDREGTVLRAVERMKPWRLTWIVRRAAGVLELPEGRISRTGTKVGDRLVRERAAS
ncbi:MAG TPA: DUF192 domain-containing protein [bacterium]|nr:DUF192 domain-containing protein [bacterium]